MALHLLVVDDLIRRALRRALRRDQIFRDGLHPLEAYDDDTLYRNVLYCQLTPSHKPEAAESSC